MASAVQTGSAADVQGTTGGGHQRVGRKRSPAQSNHRAEQRVTAPETVRASAPNATDRIAPRGKPGQPPVPWRAGGRAPCPSANQVLQQTAAAILVPRDITAQAAAAAAELVVRP
jgi:hypothetical protein